jgi:hypothetical protein
MRFRAKLTGLRGQSVLVTTLGITQTLAWASTYYLPAVMAAPICKRGLDPANWSTSSANFWVFSLEREEYPDAKEAIFRRTDSVFLEAG